MNLSFSKTERDEFVMEKCQIPCFHLPLPQSKLLNWYICDSSEMQTVVARSFS